MVDNEGRTARHAGPWISGRIMDEKGCSRGREDGIMMSLINCLHFSLGILYSRQKGIKRPSKGPSLSSTNDDVTDETPTSIHRLFEDTDEGDVIESFICLLDHLKQCFG